MRVLSLASLMVTHTRRIATSAVAVGAIACLSFAAACDKVPLLAPTGSVISIFPTSTTVPLNGSTELVVTVIENGVAATPTPTPSPTPGGGTTPTPAPTTTT